MRPSEVNERIAMASEAISTISDVHRVVLNIRHPNNSLIVDDDTVEYPSGDSESEETSEN